MATGGKRDPKTHRTPAQEKRKREEFDASPEQKKLRAKRNAARRELMREGLVSKGDGMHVDHKKMLARGGDNSRGNLRVRPAAANSGWDKGAAGYKNKKR